jgi:SAM-dependent methyltransferase
MTADATADTIDRYLRGERLWGDDFDASGIAAWYGDEKEAYAEISARSDGRRPTYVYHALNERHGFRHLPAESYGEVLGFGSAFGDEFAPIASRIQRLTIVDASDAWGSGSIEGLKTRRLKPDPSGALPLPDGHYDLITCFGVLHHVANVSAVLGELARCLRPGGHLLLREPIVSMGDWRNARPGLTKRERGIPLPLFRQIWERSGLRVLREALCAFPLTPRLQALVKQHPYLNPHTVTIDALLSRLFAWNLRYHRTTAFEKICPTCVFAVLRKH